MGSIYQGSVKLNSTGGGIPPFAYAQENGFTGTEEEFYALLAALDDFAKLDESGKVPSAQLPEMDYAPSKHSHSKSEISDFPSSMPASDVYEWAKAATKPSYSADDVGAAKSDMSNVDMTALATALGAAKIQMGSYVGNDKSGSSNKNKITFSGKPLLVFVGQVDSYFGQHAWIRGVVQGISRTYNTQNSVVEITWGDNYIEYYHTNSADYQLNTNGKTYNYVAFIE